MSASNDCHSINSFDSNDMSASSCSDESAASTDSESTNHSGDDESSDSGPERNRRRLTRVAVPTTVTQQPQHQPEQQLPKQSTSTRRNETTKPAHTAATKTPGPKNWSSIVKNAEGCDIQSPTKRAKL
eukprot:CAMPEP_0116544034 /NCGR_PEP_ID=MMETSP0397-20121206/1892_1 /TAXON_ID=216820 /ORGANISM="Cyclophora tenuis, Strain ECT3854" /LENGTH=127 /DNA_ID=CAMNT_0004068199 /DNA_START=203 /DNA_END=586 /DNA_ORIENTATION=+